MRKTLILLLILFPVFSSFGQDITGKWYGLIKVQQVQLKIVFNIVRSDNGYQTTMDSPDQGAYRIPVTSTTFENNVLKMTISSARIEYQGQLIMDEIIGNVVQGGVELPLNLSRKEVEKEPVSPPENQKNVDH